MKTLIQKDICTPLFIAALFTLVKKWKQPKCPSKDKWCMCVCVCVYTYHGILLNHKENEILPFAAMWMNLENICLVK